MVAAMLADSMSSMVEQPAPLKAAIRDSMRHPIRIDMTTAAIISKPRFMVCEVIPAFSRIRPMKEVSMNIPVTKYDRAKARTMAMTMMATNDITASIFPIIIASDLMLTMSVSTSLEDFSSMMARTMYVHEKMHTIMTIME